MILFSLLSYLFASKRRKALYKTIARSYGVSPLRVCALAKGHKGKSPKDYFIEGELIQRRLISGDSKIK